MVNAVKTKDEIFKSKYPQLPGTPIPQALSCECYVSLIKSKV